MAASRVGAGDGAGLNTPAELAGGFACEGAHANDAITTARTVASFMGT
jgi:hypothetical protein